MTEISRRKAFSLFGLTILGAAAAPVALLTTSEAEAQTVGMTRRQDRRDDRHQRRDDRRTGRQDRRVDRRAGRTERREDRRTPATPTQ